MRDSAESYARMAKKWKEQNFSTPRKSGNIQHYQPFRGPGRVFFKKHFFFQITLLNVHTLYTLNKALHWSRTPCSEANCGTLLLAINTTMEESSSPHILTCSLSSKRGQYYHRIRRVYHLFTSLTIDAKERESREMTSKKRIGLTLSLSFWIITPLYIDITIYRVNYLDVVFDSGAPWWTVLSF